MEKSKGLTYFYQNETLSAVSEGRGSVCFFRAQRTAFAETHREKGSANLLACDAHGSILNVATTRDAKRISYTPYGYLSADGRHSYLGFNGEYVDVRNVYLLGNGYRTYDPALMRFHTADSLSPFGEGGLNAYAYCQGDPANHIDPSGHVQMPNIVYAKTRTRFQARVGYGQLRSTPDPLTQKYINYLRHEKSVTHRSLTEVRMNIEKTDNQLLNFRLNNPGKLETLHDRQVDAMRANARVDSGHWHPNTRFRYAAEAREAEGGVKHYLNTYPSLAEADRYHPTLAQLKETERRLLAYSKEINAAMIELRNPMRGLGSVRS
ncbi:RHS repeat-associated core domain-containing protein [Pseudomonas monteilii]